MQASRCGDDSILTENRPWRSFDGSARAGGGEPVGVLHARRLRSPTFAQDPPFSPLLECMHNNLDQGVCIFFTLS